MRAEIYCSEGSQALPSCPRKGRIVEQTVWGCRSEVGKRQYESACFLVQCFQISDRFPSCAASPVKSGIKINMRMEH